MDSRLRGNDEFGEREVSDSDPTVDSHQHFWDIDRLTYPWMPEGDNVLRRSYLPEDLAPHLERAGISKTVVVQAQMTMAEADLLFDLGRQRGLHRGCCGVGRLDG